MKKNQAKFVLTILSTLTIGLLLQLGMVGCGKEVPKTPEETFKSFSKWTGLGQPTGMEKFAEKQYITQLYQRFDSLALLSEVWPKDILVISSTPNNDEATVKAEGKNARGQMVTGTFILKKTGEQWMVHEGDWDNLFGNETSTPNN